MSTVAVPDLETALQRAVAALCRTQDASGCWRGDYGGPGFLLPMYVGTCHLVGAEIDTVTRDGMLRYLEATQNEDGGWGLHAEGHSHVFTTALCYVALRQLGVAPDAPAPQRGREWLAGHGGPTAAASWGKFFLAVQGLYAYEGLNPVLPELWLLPRHLPVHPSRLWCHSRVVYLPMAWLYGSRAQAPVTELVRELRRELYPEGFDRVDWRGTRDRVASTDSYVPHSRLLRATNRALLAYERAPRAGKRQRALDTVLDHIDREDRNTSYLCIGPVNKLYHTLVWHFARPGGTELGHHLARLPEYLSQHPLGVRMNGYNGSQLWDTAFAVQALATAADEAPTLELKATLGRAYGFVEASQVRADVPDREAYFRDPSRGGWPFSTRDHGWPITDCTAEGLKACLALAPHGHVLPEARLREAVELILYWQNDDGGWATYERTRGPRWLEQLNPSDAFGSIMIDYPWVECTSACVQALAAYQKRHDHPALEGAIARGARFIQEQQRSDGSWEGNWGVCFTYGTWFGVWGLRAAGLAASHSAIQTAADFLVAHQGDDGGWGESIESCRERRYVATPGQAVMTAWALLALVAAGRGASPAVERGARFLVDRQREDGTFPPEGVAGVFNRTCGIHYDNYLGIFPLWALAKLRAELR